MKTRMMGIAISVLALLVLLLPDSALAKKGGIGQGGGYSDDGVLYHSHSDRSYSGKDEMKGQGKARGKFKEKTGQGKGKKASQGTVEWGAQAR